MMSLGKKTYQKPEIKAHKLINDNVLMHGSIEPPYDPRFNPKDNDFGGDDGHLDPPIGKPDNPHKYHGIW